MNRHATQVHQLRGIQPVMQCAYRGAGAPGGLRPARAGLRPNEKRRPRDGDGVQRAIVVFRRLGRSGDGSIARAEGARCAASASWFDSSRRAVRAHPRRLLADDLPSAAAPTPTGDLSLTHLLSRSLRVQRYYTIVVCTMNSPRGVARPYSRPGVSPAIATHHSSAIRITPVVRATIERPPVAAGSTTGAGPVIARLVGIPAATPGSLARSPGYVAVKSASP